MPSLGRAFVEVHADTSPFPRELRREMARLSTTLREDTDRQGRLIGQRLGLRMRQGLRESIGRRRLTIPVDPEVSPVSVARTEAALRAVTRDRQVNVNIDRNRLTRGLALAGGLIGNFVIGMIRVFGDFLNFGRQIGQILSESFANLSRSLTGVAVSGGNAASAMANLAAAIAAITVVLTIVLGLFATLAAVLTAVVQAVQLLITLVPGLGVGFLVGIAPVVLIFTNLVDAVKATTGEFKAFQGEIEDFGEQTQRSLTSLRDLVQFFLGIREQVQEAFFRPVNQALADLNANLGPTFREGFVQVADAAGRFAASFIELFNHPSADFFFQSLFDLAELGFEEIGDAGINFAASIANLIEETMPQLKRAVDEIADVIDGWAVSINEFADDPNLTERLMEWEESLESILDLANSIGDAIFAFVDGFRQAGALDVLEDLTDLFDRMAAFFRSDDSELFFRGLILSAGIFINFLEISLQVLSGFLIVLGLIDFFFTEIVNKGRIWEGVLFVAQRPLSAIRNILNGIFEFALSVARTIRDWIERLNGGRSIFATIRNIASSIATFTGRVRDRLGSAFSHVRNMLSWTRSVRDAIRGAASFAASFRNALSTALGWVRQIRDTAARIVFPSGTGFLGAVLQGIFGQEGGIFTRPTPLIIGEAGPEVLIPLSRPQRARELIAASGLTGLIRGGDGASMGSMGNVPVIRLTFESDGTAAGDAVLTLLRHGVRIRGGDVSRVVNA